MFVGSCTNTSASHQMTRSRRRKQQRFQSIARSLAVRASVRAAMSVASALLVSTHSAHAADAPETTGETSGGLQEVVVTAQKRTERLQDVPVSIQALGADKL